MSFGNRIDELKKDIAKLENQLKAKDAIIAEAISAYSSLPPKPDNYALIQTILGINLKQRESPDLNIQCGIHSMFIYNDFLYVITEVVNDSSNRAVASGLCISCSVDGTGCSETIIGIFDDMTPVKFIEKCSRRRLVISIPKEMMMEPELILEIEFQLISAESSVDPRLLPNLPTGSFSGHMRDSFCFLVQGPVRALVKGNVADLTVDDGVLLYQAVFTSHVSRYVDFQATQLSSVFRNIETFKVIDFGDWQLVVGSSDHEGLLAVCPCSSFKSAEANCSIFARDSVTLDRFEYFLRTMVTDKSDE